MDHNESRVAALQEKLIEDIQKGGIAHVLSWIDGYYTEYAEAALRDRLADPGLAPLLKEKEGRQLYLTYLLYSEAPSADSSSSSMGTNALRRAQVAAVGRLARRELAATNNDQWKAYLERMNASKETPAE